MLATAQSTTIVREVVVIGVVPNELDSTSSNVQVPRKAFVMLLKLTLLPLLARVSLVQVIKPGRDACKTPFLLALSSEKVLMLFA
jgi:hypothetical protein